MLSAKRDPTTLLLGQRLTRDYHGVTYEAQALGGPGVDLNWMKMSELSNKLLALLDCAKNSFVVELPFN